MKKFFKNLAVWWGLAWHNHSSLIGFMSLASMVFLYFLPLSWMPADKYIANELILVIPSSCFFVIILLWIGGDHLSKSSRNWKVANDKARKLMKTLQSEKEKKLLSAFIVLTGIYHSGKKLIEIMNLITKRDHVRAELEKLNQEQIRLLRESASLAYEFKQLEDTISALS